MGLYDKNLFKGRNDIEDLRKRGIADYEYGSDLVKEGIGGLRELRDIYAGRTKDPLGEYGRGLFSRARGNLSDAYARNVNSGAARRQQLATQSGGALTVEQVAALNAEDQRAAGEGLFRGENDLAMTEADMSLSAQERFYDRMEGIDRAKGAVGSDEKARGISSIIQNLMFRSQKDAQKRQILSSFANALIGNAAGGAANSGYYGTAATTTTQTQNPWGVR